MRLVRWAAIWVMLLAGLSPSILAAPPANWPKSLTIATASPGGIYYVYGHDLAPILSQALGIPVSAQASQGPSQNILLLESGEAPLGFITMGIALQAWNGTGEWTNGKKLRQMRALFPMYDTSFQFVALPSSGIKSLADFAGKRIGVGPQGGTGGTYAPLVFKTLQIPAMLRYGAWKTISEQLRSHLLDGVVATAGVPTPFITEFDTEQPLRFVAPSDKEIAILHEAMPELGVSVVPQGSYPLLESEYKTIGMLNFAVASKDLPDDLVYAIVKAFYANYDRMLGGIPAAQKSVVADVKRNHFLPYHPGAVRYYREIGIKLPAELTPTP